MTLSKQNAEKNRRLSLRRLPRGKVKVTCRKGTLDLGINLAVTLLDISESGLRLVVKDGLAQGQEVSVTLEGQNHLRPLHFLGQIVWVVPAQEPGQHCVGIELKKRLAYADYHKLT